MSGHHYHHPTDPYYNNYQHHQQQQLPLQQQQHYELYPHAPHAPQYHGQEPPLPLLAQQPQGYYYGARPSPLDAATVATLRQEDNSNIARVRERDNATAAAPKEQAQQQQQQPAEPPPQPKAAAATTTKTPKKSWRNYPRYHFNKSEGRKRLKIASDALRDAEDHLKEAQDALKIAQDNHDARVQDLQEISRDIVDELLEAERPRPWNKMYFQLVDFYERHGHCFLSVRASTAKKKMDRAKQQSKTKTKKKGEKQAEEKKEEPSDDDKVDNNNDNNDNDNNDNSTDDIDLKEIGTLGRWAAGQRNNRKKGKLEEWKIVALDRLQFVWDAREASWHETYQELKDFYNQHGHIRVLEKQNPSLNRWLRFQRDNYREFQANGYVEKRDDGVFGMNQERCDLLEALGMDWRDHDERWIVLFQKLKQIYETQGHLRTLPTSNKNSDKLKDFVAKQRQAYKEYQQKGGHDCAAISTERVLLLESIHFPWTEEEDPNNPPEKTTRSNSVTHQQPHYDDQWMKHYNLAKGFYQKHHHFDYEQHHDNEAQAKRMRAWDQRQRQLYGSLRKRSKSNKLRQALPRERLELLNVLGFFQQDPDDRNWPKYMEHLRRFHAQHGHAMVMYHYPGNADLQELADWAMVQRQEYAKYENGQDSKLIWDRVYQLETLGFNFDLPPLSTTSTKEQESGESRKRPLESADDFVNQKSDKKSRTSNARDEENDPRTKIPAATTTESQKTGGQKSELPEGDSAPVITGTNG